MQTRYRTSGSPYQGITLIELMVGLALVGILLSWGAPDLIGLYQRNLLSAQTERLVSDLYHARSEAIKRNLPVVVCRSDDAANCTPSSHSLSDWGIGWISFVNRDDDKFRDEGEELLRVGTSVPKRVSLQFNHWWRLTFRPNGRAGNGTFTLCDPDRNQNKITVYMSGRTRISRRREAEFGCPEY